MQTALGRKCRDSLAHLRDQERLLPGDERERRRGEKTSSQLYPGQAEWDREEGQAAPWREVINTARSYISCGSKGWGRFLKTAWCRGEHAAGSEKASSMVAGRGGYRWARRL